MDQHNPDFSTEDIIKIQSFCQSIINKPRMIEEQPHKREGVYLFCEDWELIEICKYFYNGKNMYLNDPPPHRLNNNPLWSKEDIIQKAEALLREFSTIEEIVKHLKKKRNGSS